MFEIPYPGTTATSRSKISSGRHTRMLVHNQTAVSLRGPFPYRIPSRSSSVSNIQYEYMNVLFNNNLQKSVSKCGQPCNSTAEGEKESGRIVGIVEGSESHISYEALYHITFCHTLHDTLRSPFLANQLSCHIYCHLPCLAYQAQRHFYTAPFL
jgi:hypothetical protein